MVFGAARSAATPTNVFETPLSITGQKRHPQDPEKDLMQKPKQEANARGVYGYNGCRNRRVPGVNSRPGRLLRNEEGDDLYQIEEEERIRLTRMYESQKSYRGRHDRWVFFTQTAEPPSPHPACTTPRSQIMHYHTDCQTQYWQPETPPPILSYAFHAVNP
jgi:hypothetical protein